MSDQLDLTAFVLWATEKLQINRQISDLRSAHPGLTKDELANKWAKYVGFMQLKVQLPLYQVQFLV